MDISRKQKIDVDQVDAEDLREFLDYNDKEQRREALKKVLNRYPFARKDPLEESSGVLLSDEILYYVSELDLIDPFDIEKLRPASYRLCVGKHYSVEGEIHTLNDPSDTIEIPPFQVAVIQTKERVNMPPFLIGRWNIRVKLAYEGLLWVGGPQVDPGYAGHLFCPIYNLSRDPVRLDYGDQLAVLDFVKTTRFVEDGRDEIMSIAANSDWDTSEFKPRKFTRPHDDILFEDYSPDQLTSGLFEEVQGELNDIRQELDTLRRTLYIGLAVGITILAILFSVLSIVVSSQLTGSLSEAQTLIFSFAESFATLFVGLIILLVILVGIFKLDRRSRV